MPRGLLVDDEVSRAQLEGQAQRLALPCPQGPALNDGRDWLSQRPFHDPARARHGGTDLSCDGRRNRDLDKQRPKEIELIDLLQGDERTRVRHRGRGHRDSLAAFSAAHSSSVMSRYGIPRLEARRMKASREVPRSSPALPLEIAPRR